MKDRTRYSQYGNYVFGWEGNKLQEAIDKRYYLGNCSFLTAIAPEVKNKCSVPVTVTTDEHVDACKSLLFIAFIRHLDLSPFPKKAKKARY